MLKAVSRDLNLTERATQQLQDLIVDRSFKPGDRLPSENEMAKMLGVSRTVVREAIRSLSAQGLVESRAGSGIYVQGLSYDVMKAPMALLFRSQVLSVEDVIEARELLEIKIAGLAAERAKPADLDALKGTIRTLARRKLTHREFAEADVAFHQYLAKAAANPLISALANSINGLMLEIRMRSIALDGEFAVQKAILYHSEILKQVKARNVEGARSEMAKHLGEARDTLRRAHVSLAKEWTGERG